MLEWFRRNRCALLHDADYWPVGPVIRCKVCNHERPNPCAIQPMATAELRALDTQEARA